MEIDKGEMIERQREKKDGNDELPSCTATPSPTCGLPAIAVIAATTHSDMTSGPRLGHFSGAHHVKTRPSVGRAGCYHPFPVPLTIFWRLVLVYMPM